MPPCRLPSDRVVVPVFADASLIELRFQLAWPRCSLARWSALRCPCPIRQWSERWHRWCAHLPAKHHARAPYYDERPVITTSRYSTNVHARPWWMTPRDDKHSDREWRVHSHGVVIHHRPFDPDEKKQNIENSHRMAKTRLYQIIVPCGVFLRLNDLGDHGWVQFIYTCNVRETSQRWENENDLKSTFQCRSAVSKEGQQRRV